jgi:hypothetical protein
MKAIQFGSGTDLHKVVTHIHVTLRNLAPLEIGLAQELLRRQELHLDSHLEQVRQAKSGVDAFDPEIAAAEAEVQRVTALVTATEGELQKAQKSKDSWAKRDAFNQMCQVRADAADHVQSLTQRKLVAQSELESLGAQRPSIDASLVSLRSELTRIEAFYLASERKA